MLYHASKERGLKYLEPHVSTHGKSFVYAVRNKITAILFGAPKDDFDLLIDEIDGIPHLYECYPYAAETIYSGKSCSLYAVSEKGFISNETGWDPELVCENAVPVIQEENIRDIFSYLSNAAARDKCVIHRYSDEHQYQCMLREELGERISCFGLNEEDIKKDPRLARFADQWANSDLSQ